MKPLNRMIRLISVGIGVLVFLHGLIVAFECYFPVYKGDREKVRRLPFKSSQER